MLILASDTSKGAVSLCAQYFSHYFLLLEIIHPLCFQILFATVGPVANSFSEAPLSRPLQMHTDSDWATAPPPGPRRAGSSKRRPGSSEIPSDVVAWARDARCPVMRVRGGGIAAPQWSPRELLSSLSFSHRSLPHPKHFLFPRTRLNGFIFAYIFPWCTAQLQWQVAIFLTCSFGNTAGTQGPQDLTCARNASPGKSACCSAFPQTLLRSPLSRLL